MSRRLLAPRKDPTKPTDAEKAAEWEMWNPLTAQSGTYQVKLEGDKLTLTAKSAAGQPVSETTMTLMRVE